MVTSINDPSNLCYQCNLLLLVALTCSNLYSDRTRPFLTFLLSSLSLPIWNFLHLLFPPANVSLTFSPLPLPSHPACTTFSPPCSEQDFDKPNEDLVKHHASISELKRNFMEAVPESRPSEWEKRLSTHSPFRNLGINGQPLSGADGVSAPLKLVICLWDDYIDCANVSLMDDWLSFLHVTRRLRDCCTE